MLVRCSYQSEQRIDGNIHRHSLMFRLALLCMVRPKVLVVLNNKLLCCSASKLGASSPCYLHSVVLFILCSKSMDVSASILGI